MSIGSIIKSGITRGLDDEAILKEVYKDFPQANTKVASIRWYRSQMKKDGGAAPVKKPAAAAVSKALPSAKAKGSDGFEDAMKGAAERWEEFKKEAGVATGVPSTLYEIKSPKNLTGMEGSGFQASLYRGGKKVATATDWGDGGPVHWEWVDHSTARVDVNTVNYKDEPHTYKGTPEEAIFAAHCLALPKEANPYDKTKTPYHVSPDCAIEEMVNDVQLRKQYRTLTKGKIAFIVDGNLYTTKAEPTVENVYKYVLGKHPKAQVLNRMTEQEGVALLKSQQQ